MSSLVEYNLSSRPITVSLGDQTMLVSLAWYSLLNGEKQLNSIVAKNRHLNSGIVNQYKSTCQAAFLTHNYRGALSPIPSIIENILVNNTLDGLWFFVHEVDPDLVWYFVVDEFGSIDTNSDQVVNKNSFLEILDEYLLVANDSTYIFTSNYELPSDFSGDIVESAISPDVLTRIVGQSRVQQLGKKRILGIPVIWFYTLFSFLLFTITYFSISFIISPITQAKSHTNLPGFPRVNDSFEWNKIKDITTNSANHGYVSHYVANLIPSIPLDFNGWDTRAINLTSDKTTIVYTSSPESRVPLSEFSMILLDRYKKSDLNIADFNISNILASKSRTKVLVEFKSDYVEKIAGYTSLADYKKFLGEDVREQKKEQAKVIKQEYNKIKALSDLLVTKYANHNPLTLLYLNLNGDYELDSQTLINMSHRMDLKKNQYYELLKDIKKPIVPNPKILSSITINPDNISDLFDFEKKTALIDIRIKRQEQKNKLILSTFTLNGIGVKRMVELTQLLNQELPIRVTSIIYNWMDSSWNLNGAIYEN